MNAKLFSALLLPAFVGPAIAARVDFVRNSAKTGSGSLKAGMNLAGGAIATGDKSKLQFSLGQRGSLLRAGSKTQAFLNENEKTLSLSHGIALTSSGKTGRGREEMNVETPETKSSVKGTMLIAYKPESHIKITCIEGTVRIRMKAKFTEFISLSAGQMVVINPADLSLPEPVDIDLAELTSTSTLLAGDFPELTADVQGAVARQAKALDKGGLDHTPLVLDGNKLTVDQGIESQRILEDPTIPTTDLTRSREVEESGSGGGSPSAHSPSPTDGFTLVDNCLEFIDQVFDNPSENFNSFDFFGTNFKCIRIINSTISAYYVDIHNDAGGAGAQTIIRNSSITGNTRQTTFVDGKLDHAIHIDNSTIRNVGGGTIIIGTGGPIDISASALEGVSVDVLADFGSSGSNPNSVTIHNSSQVLAVAGEIKIRTAGGPINISNSSLRATGGELLIDTQFSGSNSLINLSNVSANADVIRARAFAGGGDALLINGGTYNAASLLKFYAEGGGKLRFTGNVNVNSPDITFAGQNVNVDLGSRVSTNSRSKVFAGSGSPGDGHNYNTSTSGTISPSPTAGAFSSRPGF